MPMTVLKAPSLGPIVGHTTSTSARLWIRGMDADGSHRTVGVGALFDSKDRLVKGSLQYFRLHRDYDRTGTVDFTELTPGVSYTARLGCLIVDSQDPDVLVDDEEVWAKLPKVTVWADELRSLPAEESEARFTTFPEAAAEAPLKFFFGSCRYPGLFTNRKSDVIYGTIRKRAEEQGYHFGMLVGDQIYADEFNRVIPIGKADTEAEFHDRYMTAFGSPNQRALMQQLPTYMILDDHEIEDNWVNGRLWKDSSRRLFNMAIQAYLSYQWVHGPRQAWDGRQNTRFLYYSFECLGFPFFVLDERSQRIKEDEDNNLDDNHLLGMPAKVGVDGTVYNGQLERFCAWLVTQQQQVGARPKFVVSPSVFVPNELDGRKDPKKSDSWPAFPETRRAVMKTIVENRVQNVVFLGGDVHCSNIAEIDFEGTPEAAQLKAFAITSSAFYWPFPFADGDPNSFVHDSRKEKDGFQVNDAVTMHYKARGFEQDDNFTEVEVDDGARRITIRNIGQKGAILKEDVLRY